MGKLIGLYIEAGDQFLYVFQKNKNLISIFLIYIGKILWVNLYNSGLCYQIGAASGMFKGGNTIQEKRKKVVLKYSRESR